MDRLLLRSRSLLGRPLSPACARRGPLLLTSSSQRFSFSSTSHLSAELGRFSAADRYKLPDTPCRTRFAPSPTGFMHLGSLRTALYNYLLARATGGQFVLRIEDTDQTRLVPDAERRLLEDLDWAGLSFDEGPGKQGPYGPYRQSERLSLYKEHADRLVREGKAYRCFCSPEALEEQKRVAHESNLPTVYPGTCREVSLEESDDRAHRGDAYAVRFKSGKEPLTVQDIIYKRFRNKSPEEDFIIMKRDGFPTYHFANVVDDHHMKITHVIRGAEWLISTPKHVEMYQAFGWEPPQFAHLGLLVDMDRKKLSKRDMSANLEFYQHRHVLPSALLNFLLFLGWRAPPGKDSVMSLQDMVDNFTFQFSKGDIVVALTKLRFLQNKHLERLIAADPKTPAQTHQLTRDFVAPLRSAIEQVECARRANINTDTDTDTDTDAETSTNTPPALAPGSLPTADLGPMLPLPAQRILADARFHADLFRLVHTNKPVVSDASEIAGDAVARLRYFVWEVPPRLLETQLRQGRLEPVAPAGRAAQLRRALACLAGRLGAAEGAVWDGAGGGGGLKNVLDDVAADPAYAALFEAGNAQGNVYTPLRWALVALEKGLPVANTMEILGREETLRRLRVAEAAAGAVAAEQTCG